MKGAKAESVKRLLFFFIIIFGHDVEIWWLWSGGRSAMVVGTKLVWPYQRGHYGGIWFCSVRVYPVHGLV